MPVIPLYIPPAATADAWHRVTAPGGYESWQFDAEDATNDVRILGMLCEGFIFHPGYLRRYARYRRWPTLIAPPAPGEYPCASFAVYRGGGIAWECVTQFAPADYHASDTGVDVRMGPNTLRREQDGSLRLHLEAARSGETKLTADLSFRPRFENPPLETTILSRELSGADHRWVIADPLCEVTGQVHVAGAAELAFAGRGYHDHRYGTGPLGPGLRRWIGGRVLLEDRVLAFHLAEPRDRRLPDEVHVVESDAGGMRERAMVDVEADWSGSTGRRLKYPRRLRLGNAFSLQNPRVIDARAFRLRLTYDALIDGRPATALCEVVHPRRLRWPVLGRILEMSISR